MQAFLRRRGLPHVPNTVICVMEQANHLVTTFSHNKTLQALGKDMDVAKHAVKHGKARSTFLQILRKAANARERGGERVFSWANEFLDKPLTAPIWKNNHPLTLSRTEQTDHHRTQHDLARAWRGGGLGCLLWFS